MQIRFFVFKKFYLLFQKLYEKELILLDSNFCKIQL
jgi:hypothetical protein